MSSVALRGLWGRKLRTVLTAFAIVLGIATISGTFVLTDSISHAFDAIFSNIYRRHRRVDHRQVGGQRERDDRPAAVRRVAARRR